MPAYELAAAIKSVADEKEIKLTGGQIGRVDQIQRDLESKKIDADQAMQEIESEFSYHFKREDYEMIEKQIR